MPETMKLFGGTKKLIDKKQNGGHVPSLEKVEVILVQQNLVDNQQQQKSEVLHTYLFTCYVHAYLLNVEPSNLVSLKTYNTELDDVITFTDQNGRPLEIEDKYLY